MNLPELSIEYYYFLYGIVAGVLIAAVITLVVAIIWKLFSNPAGRKDKVVAVKAELPPKITDMPLLEALAKETEEKQKQKTEQAKSAQKQIREIMGDKPVVVVSRRRGGNTHG